MRVERGSLVILELESQLPHGIHELDHEGPPVVGGVL